MKKGYIQIYTGEGKGKTTAAMGLAIRAVGRGLEVLIIQFLKGGESGEVSVLKNIDGIDVHRVSEVKKFFWNMSDQEKQNMRELASTVIKKTVQQLKNGEMDVLILDEVLGALNKGIITIDEVNAVLESHPEHVEVVLTGRDAPKWLIDKAHLVTEMVPIKHYFSEDVKARKGIEF